MKTLITLLLLTFCSQMTLAQSQKNFRKRPGLEYYGAQNQEATYDLIADILMTTKKDIAVKDVQREMNSIYKYILGQMRRNYSNPAASYPKYSLELLQTAPEKDGVIRVTFKMSAKGVFKPGQKAYTFLVPLEHSKLFAQSKQLCTSERDVDSGNFWYHWEPKIPGCPLIEGVHYTAVTAKLTYLPNTTLTYPEYNKFELKDGTLKATYMFGLESYTDTNWNANTSGDWGALWYRQTRDYLEQNFKFQKRPWSDEEIAALVGYNKPADGSNWPTIEDYTLDTRQGVLRFRLFLGGSGLNHESAAFHKILQDSLFNENVVFYSGHSGIGKNIDLERIERLRKMNLPLSRQYQIYFWGGCVPYSYYTDMFFMRKQNLTDPQGTEKLDIIAYGNESVFTANDDQRLIQALVNYMSVGQRTSYQEIIGQEDRYFLGVSGDEDNPTE